jgi:hypothetical protein
MEYIEISNNYRHVSISEDGKKIIVKEIFPPPESFENAKFLSDLVAHASDSVQIPEKFLVKAMSRLDADEKTFVPVFTRICHIYFSSLFYSSRFINPSVIDAWAEVFELKIDSSAESIRSACTCWWEDSEDPA